MNSNTIRITFLSDWHVGEGAGAVGHIDRLVRRDPQDGLPFVPAKTLTGIVRDACERVAGALDEGSRAGPWSEFCDRLFGRQSKGVGDAARAGHTTPALLRFGPARYEPALRQALRAEGHRALRAAVTFIKPGVKIDPKTGMAQDDMLRLEEVALAGSELEAEWNLAPGLPDEVRDAALALLAAGCRTVERLGAKRRRGNGRCELQMNGAPENWQALLAQDPPAWEPADPATLELVPSQAGSAERLGLRLELHLRSPVVVPAATLGNVVACRDHIPATLLLPALDSALRKALGERAAELTSLLASGRIQVRSAYPALGTVRLLPVPLAFEAEKEAPGKLRNGFFPRESGLAAIQFKPMREGYVPESFIPESKAGRSPLVRAATQAFTHATIDDGAQRPTAEVGGVYTYEALAPGQMFQAELWVEAGLVASLEALIEALPAELRIGRAKKDDYGRVALRASKLAAPAAPAEGALEEATLWLVAPLLARDERLAPIVEAQGLAAWLQARLPSGYVVTVLEDRCRAFREEGWMNAWREPRPSRIGLAAGSCVKLRFEPPVPAERLAAWQRDGLGERRGEGYGEVRVEPILLKDELPPRQALGAEDSVTDTHPALESDFAIALHRRAWRQRIREHVQTQAASIAKELGWTSAKPGNSQLGALRSQFEGWCGTDEERSRFLNWWQHLLEVEKRREQWPAPSRSEQRKPIQAFGDDADAIWQALAASGLQHEHLPCCLAQKARDTLRKGMAAEATRIYWLGVIGAELKRRADEDKRKQKQGEEMRHGA